METNPEWEAMKSTTINSEYVTDVSHIEPTDPRKLLKITDLPSNWEAIKHEYQFSDFNFESWRQSKIDAGTWIEKRDFNVFNK